MHKTAAWPLAWLYVGLIAYASLYPFVGWRDQGMAPWTLLEAPWAHYWSGFDVVINVLGYMPLGVLLVLGAVRSGRRKNAVWRAVLGATLLSLCMEMLQSYLPTRVASREDWLLNTLGAAAGGLLTLLLDRIGALDRWSRIRARWFVPESRGGIVLLALWPWALLFPPAVPFGLGQVLFRVQEALSEWLDGTQFMDWVPPPALGNDPLAPGAELLCVFLGVLIPCLLGFCITRKPLRRVGMVAMVVVSGVGATTLSAALSWGPAHAWAWLELPTQVGMASAVLVALGMVLVPWRASAATLMVGLGLYLSLLNQAPESPYFSQTLQIWEQGRFIRFHGLAQWLGWLWPYATLAYVFSLNWRRDAKT